MPASQSSGASTAARALEKVDGWQKLLRERIDALSFRRLAGKGGGPSPWRSTHARRERPPSGPGKSR
jgi:hypothetical protein